MLAVETRGLSKRFGNALILDSINLAIAHQECVALLGPSGAGKSTLLRCIAGLEPVSSGQVIVQSSQATAGQLDHLPPTTGHVRRHLSYVSQDYALYPQLNVLQNLQTALLALKLPRAHSEQRCAEAMGWFRIEALAKLLPSQLSGGQAQRVALAKAIVRRPSLLLLDEPFSQLDRPLHDELRTLLAKVVEHYRISLLFVTHDPFDAMQLANRWAVLVAGRLIQLDHPDRVYRNPANRTAAELTSPWGIHWLELGSLKSCKPNTLSIEIERALKTGGSIGFRPESAQLQLRDSEENDAAATSPAPAGATNCETSLEFPVIIQRVQSLGFATMAHVDAGGSLYRCLSLGSIVPGAAALLKIPTEALVRCDS